ncbi:MAG TPA: hemerythrin domain-containing protein [Thermoanaerobaculia bacterium]|nr:hemerythrin domain-containing protein [Thermoanaerobaculia bacterium]
MADAITLLKEDHKKVRGLLEQLEKTTERSTAKRLQLLAKIEMEIEIHAAIEEEIFYPEFKEKSEMEEEEEGEEMFYEAEEEHHLVKVVLPELKATDPSSPVFGAKSKVLKELIEHHVKEEEKEMFKMARQLFGKDELQVLGDRMAERKRKLQKQWKKK